MMPMILNIPSGRQGGGGGGRRRSYRKQRIPKKYYKAFKAMKQRRYGYKQMFKNPGWEKKGVDGSARQLFFGKDWASANEGQKTWRRVTGYRGLGGYNFLNGNTVNAGNTTTNVGVGAYRGRGEYLHNNHVLWKGVDIMTPINKMFGLGDYTPGSEGPAVQNQIIEGGNPPLSVNASADLSGDIFFNHTEFVGNVSVTGGVNNVSVFANTSYPINPGLSSTFPWLSQLAQNFILYEFQGLIFEYRPTSGEYGSATGNTLGKITMATQYDSDAAPFASSIEAANYDYAMTCKPSVPMKHGVETSKVQSPLGMFYIRTGQSNKDKVFTDPGYLQVITEGVSINNGATANVGELWVTYRVRLSRATLFGSLLGKTVNSDSFVFAQTASAFSATQINTYLATYGALMPALWVPPSFGSGNGNGPVQSIVAASKKSNNLGGVLSFNGATSITYTFPAGIAQGLYKFTFTVQPVTGITFSVITPNVVNGTLQTESMWTSSGGAAENVYSFGNGLAANQTCGQMWFVQVAAPGALQCTVTVAFAAGATAIMSWCVDEVCTGCYTA